MGVILTFFLRGVGTLGSLRSLRSLGPLRTLRSLRADNRVGTGVGCKKKVQIFVLNRKESVSLRIISYSALSIQVINP